MSDISTSLREFIKENFLYGAEQAYSDDDSFMENGIVDSTGVLELIMHLETSYGISIEDTELVPENLDSISNLKRFIESKTNSATIAETA